MPAPKGNKYALGNNGGRPRKYETPEDMELKIVEYFESLEEEVIFVKELEVEHHLLKNKRVTDKHNKLIGYHVWLRENTNPSVCRMAAFLGFANRVSLYEYRDQREEFAFIIKRAIGLIESHYENNLNGGAAAGSIFALKNMGWIDRVEQDVKLTEQPLFPDID